MEVTVEQKALPSSSELYDQGKTSLGDLRELKVGQGSTIFYTDKEGSRWGHTTFAEANAWIKIDGTAQFKASDGTVLLSTGALDGNFVNVINSALNTASKTILTDFTFQTSDYAGAFKSGNPTWDENTGLITGGSGVLINARGILGANSGVATFTLDATTGNATFAGTLTAAHGTIGAITLATSGYISSGKTAYTDDTNAGFWLGDVTGTAKLNIGSSATKYIHYDGSDLTMLGGTITGGIVQTASTGYRLKMNGSSNKLELLNGDTVLASVYTSASGDITLDGTDDVNMAVGGTIKCYAANSAFKPNSDRAYDLGADDAQWDNVYADTYYAGSSGTQGKAIDDLKVITDVYTVSHDGATDLRQKYRTVTFQGGIITSISSESNELVLDKVWNG